MAKSTLDKAQDALRQWKHGATEEDRLRGQRDANRLLLRATTEILAPLPIAKPLRRGDVVGVDDEPAEIVLISASGNITVRLADGTLRTVRKLEIQQL